LKCKLLNVEPPHKSFITE